MGHKLQVLILCSH